VNELRTVGRVAYPTVEFEGLVTGSPVMHAFFELVRKVSRTDASVLIRGETGTGKELVARALHTLSHRANGPFRAINCATLNAELLESELFGHVRGAFTGAVRDRKGLFALADGGTIFLDEIAELPHALQARLLRVLQERTFVPVGGSEPQSANVRVLSATHRALREEVDKGRFREDLMYRLRVVPLYLPRLAERDHDIEILAWHFVDTFNAQGFRRVESFSVEAMRALQRYPWPGNVRELRNNLEYAFAVGEGPIIRLSELTPELQAPLADAPDAPSLSPVMRDSEREQLIHALQRCGGRKGEAATALGISRSTLWRKLREHGLS
jgi:two-component system response regulator AtoC